MNVINNWKYDYQHDFYVQHIKNGLTSIGATIKVFFNDYFSKNPIELRSLPVFAAGENPNWDELTKFIYERNVYASNSKSITKKQFEETVKKYFGNIPYTDKSSSYLVYEDGKYTPRGWDDHGSYIYELTKLEHGKTEDGKEKWKAHITGYYFYEGDGNPAEPQSMQSKNAQAVWREMAKPENKGLNYWQVRERLVWNNPGSVLDPGTKWIIEFTVNDPMGDIYFTYLSCERNEGESKEK